MASGHDPGATMLVSVNGVRLFVEVFGQKLAPVGPRMVKRPTVVGLHGGPSDHAHMRRTAEVLSEVAQVILYDQRGCGRSEAGDPELWTMEQWGDDVRGLCDVLGVEAPIVLGVSFGGFVAQAYGTRHPDHAAGLGLIVTGPRHDLALSTESFRRQGGDAAAEAWTAFATSPSPQTAQAFGAACGPLYSARRISDPEAAARTRTNWAVNLDYFRRCHDGLFDFRNDLGRVTAPVLILGGDEDPIMPPVFQDELEAGLTTAAVTRVRFANAGHQLWADAPEAYHAALRDFVLFQKA
jgi:pimeloyl-ACP methyl ester carboxylesterase